MLSVCWRQHEKGEIQGARVCLYFFFYQRRPSPRFFMGMFGSLTTRTLLHRGERRQEVCFLVRFRYLHLYLVKLEASNLGYASVCNVLLC